MVVEEIFIHVKMKHVFAYPTMVLTLVIVNQNCKRLISEQI